ncbi:PspC domain-containing protein [Corynebacterium sp.]|uniref:PspC domain-containing protein n=1 Tax=Corynebacterium sp. TaxID=1720 RepID=UPI0026DC6441|nr:PspC domain-containing protein [Corynebacterium sp.]MDO5076553.1 PspC domain-containing protein [Corynebacterium sp.]
MNAPFSDRQLYRSTTDSFVGGVLGGVAQAYGWDASLLRLGFVASFLLPGSQLFLVVLYVIGCIVIPKDTTF